MVKKETTRKPPTATNSSRTSRTSTTSPTKGRKGRVSRRGGQARVQKPVAVTTRPMPLWQRILVSLVIVVAFGFLFYWFAVRPYAYRWRPCYGFQEYGVCLPSRYTIHGLDLSHHQGTVDWDELAYHHNPIFPLRFVFMKATEGSDLADETFDVNFRSAREHGMIRGAYHYFNPKSDVNRQADFFIQHVALEQGDLPPVLDVEERGSLSKEELKRRVHQWLDRVEAHYHVKPIIYSGFKFRTKYLSDSLFNRYPYWIAHYYVDSVSYDGPWHFWQHTDKGRVPGVSKRVDLNIFRGTEEELDSLRIKN
ncbi:MAG: GH25 family lysozyme [Bacteroides sp.]